MGFQSADMKTTSLYFKCASPPLSLPLGKGETEGVAALPLAKGETEGVEIARGEEFVEVIIGVKNLLIGQVVRQREAVAHRVVGVGVILNRRVVAVLSTRVWCPDDVPLGEPLFSADQAKINEKDSKKQCIKCYAKYRPHRIGKEGIGYA
ncbi:MAG: hypothetical protein NZT92_14845 [Abditibacteriales bacterium]|nr:hypothetical protein [Abditibacteriales bacterium]